MKAVLFDLGHTLIDYYHDWKEPEMKATRKIYRIISADYGVSEEEGEFCRHLGHLLMEAREIKLEKMIEIPLADILNRCFQRYDCDGDDDLIDKALHAFYETLLEDRQLIPGVKDMLDKVRSEGYLIGLVSDVAWGLPSEFPLRDMRYYGIDQYFDDLIFSTDVGLRKPNPKIFKMALSNLGAKPDEAIFIGNSLQADIRGAKGIGMVAVLKKSKFYQHDDSIVPDEKISDWNEIDRVLTKHGRR